MKQWLVVLCMFIVVVLSIPHASMAENPQEIPMAPICYVMIDGIPDDSTANRNHEIEGLRVSYGVHLAAMATTTRPQPEALIITKLVSAATPKLFQALLTGQHIRSAQIKFVRPSAQGGQLEVYYSLKLEEVMLSNIHQFSDGSRFLEDISLTAKRIEIAYSGANRSPMPFRFDFSTMK